MKSLVDPDEMTLFGKDDRRVWLVFPNANYFISGEEWKFRNSDTAMATAPANMIDIARRNLHPLKDRLTFLEDATETVPGVQAIATFGHTPGHIALAITSEGERLLHVSDAALHPLQLEHPEWTPAFDLLPEQASTSKRRIFGLAAEEDTLVFAHHFPPSLTWDTFTTKSRDGTGNPSIPKQA